MRNLVFALAAVTLAAGAADARNRGDVPEATPVGPAVSCVPLQNIRSTQVHGDRVIDFHMTDGKVYRNTLPNSCPNLGFEERFSYKTSLSELCSVDIIHVLQSAGGRLEEGAGCGLGSFQPVKLVSAK